MTEILVRPPELRRAADQLRAGAEKIGQAVESVDADMRALKGVEMLGNRADRLQVRYQGKRDALVRAKELILSFAASLEASAGTFEDADKSEQTSMPDQKINLEERFQEFQNTRPNYDAKEVGYPRGALKWLAELIGFYREDITEKEADLLDKLLGPLGLDYGKLWEMNQIHDEAFKIEAKYYGEDSNNDNQADAFRHAYWSARLTQAFGSDWAKEFTDAHESKPGNGAARDFMDRWNNELGITIAKENPNATPEELANLVFKAMQDGKGVYIPGADQYPIDSPERNGLAEKGPLAYTNQ